MFDVSGNDNLSAGDVLLYRSNTWVAWGIRWLDGTEVSHAGLYLGDDVAEALGLPGLVRRPLSKSIKACDWVQVWRLTTDPGTMEPVLNIARAYLDQGNRYGYEQILLLAGICLTRKLDIHNRLLRRVVRAAMRQAVNLISHLHREGKEPMICSEFVYRTYDQALLEPDDPYSLEILSQEARQSCRCFSRLRRLGGWFGRTAQPALPTVHPESLLGQLAASSETVDSLSAPSTLKLALPAIDEDLDRLIEQYAAEVGGNKTTEVAATSVDPEVTDDELLDTARLLAGELAASVARKAEIEKTIHGGPPEAAERATPKLNEILADFVTPGDLLKSPSLEQVGTIEP